MAEELQVLFSTSTFRVYRNDDVIGCEVAGALKNVMAIAAGMADGMGFGDNTKAALLTRGLAELTRLGVALGGQPLTFAGLAGMGDLVATCSSRQSRNRHVGEELGKGRNLEEIIAEMSMVAEGVKTARSVVALARACEGRDADRRAGGRGARRQGSGRRRHRSADVAFGQGRIRRPLTGRPLWPSPAAHRSPTSTTAGTSCSPTAGAWSGGCWATTTGTFPRRRPRLRQHRVDNTPIIETVIRVPGGDVAVRVGAAVAGDGDEVIAFECENRALDPGRARPGVDQPNRSRRSRSSSGDPHPHIPRGVGPADHRARAGSRLGGARLAGARAPGAQIVTNDPNTDDALLAARVDLLLAAAVWSRSGKRGDADAPARWPTRSVCSTTKTRPEYPGRAASASGPQWAATGTRRGRRRRRTVSRRSRVAAATQLVEDRHGSLDLRSGM